MKIKVNKTNVIVAMIAIMVAITITLGVSLTVINNSLEKTKEAKLNYNLAKGKVAVEDYKTSYAGKKFNFNDSAFKKAEIAKNYITPDSDPKEIEELASSLKLESIIITDVDGKYVAAYPNDLVGKNLKDDDDTKYFRRIVQGTTKKSVSEPYMVDNNNSEYEYYCAIAREDDNGLAGAVIIKEKTTQYDEVIGSDIIYDCNDGTIVARDGVVIGSSLEDVHGLKLDDINVKQIAFNEEFNITKSGNEYVAKAIKVDEFVIVTGIPTANFVLTNHDIFMFIASGVAGLFVGVIIVLISAKLRKKEDK